MQGRGIVWGMRNIAIATVLMLSGLARAGPVLFPVDGTGNVHVQDVIPPELDKVASITSTGTGAIDLVGPSDTAAGLKWDLSSTSNSARMEFDLSAFGGQAGQGTSDATVKFRTDVPAHYQLRVRFPELYGNRSFGEIDGKQVGFEFNFMDPAPGGEKSIAGDLAAGDHELLVQSFAAQTRSNPLRSDGSIVLNVTAVPLPAALYPGLAVLGSIAACSKGARAIVSRRL